MKFKVGRINLAATIFVPYDCNNNCPFCTTKSEYKDTSTFSIDRIIDSIRLINHMPSVTDIVFTGGEPFANIKLLDKMIKAVDHSKNIYVNTTLPMNTAREAVAYINASNRITGINISRHIESFVSNSSDIFIGDIRKPIRINCVLFKQYTDVQLHNFILRYSSATREINFRADYTKITQDTLKTLADPFISQLSRMSLEYSGSSGCLVCNTDIFLTSDNNVVAYHRGIENSAVNIGNVIVVNDLIIKQDGKLYYDWNKQDKDLDNLIATFSVMPGAKQEALVKEVVNAFKSKGTEGEKVFRLVPNQTCHSQRVSNQTCHSSYLGGGC